MLSVFLRSIYIGLLVTCDLVFLLLFALIHKVGVDMLGMISLLWSSVYIPVNLFASKISDDGRIGFVSLISTVSSIVSLYLLIHFYNDLLILILSYIFHSIALSTGRVSHNVSLNESYYFEEWSRYSIISSSLQRFTYVAILVTLFLEHNLVAAIYRVVLLGFLISLIFPFLISYRGFERRYGSLVSKIDNVSTVTRYMILVPDIRGDVSSYTRNWFESQNSVTPVIISALLTSVAVELIMVPIPATFRSLLGQQGLLIIYIIIGILTGFSILLLSGTASKPYLIGALRVPLVIFILYLIPQAVNIEYIILLGLVYAVISVLNNMFTTTLYNMYNQRSFGYGLGIYMSILEIGSVIGDLLIWLILGGLGYNIIIIISAILFILSIIFLR
ncbi:MAG: hypothetical protein ACP5GI_07530 [Sulfolobales archaeon]